MRNKTVITITLNVALSDHQESLVPQLLADCFHNFTKNREDPRAYFERVYGNRKVYATEQDREEKIQDISTRNGIAEELFGASHKAKVEVTLAPDAVRFIGDGQYEVRTGGDTEVVQSWDKLSKAHQEAMSKAFKVLPPGQTTENIWQEL